MIPDLQLTPKQQRFCDEYLIDMNATKAALRAGYSGNTALNGSLMSIPKIKLYLQQRTAEIAQQVQVNHQMILAELAKIAFGNMGNYFAPDGRMKPMDELTADEKAALGTITVKETNAGKDTASVTTRIKLNNKMAALDKLAKHLKFYDAAAPQPEVVYVYVDKDNLDDYDRFDDDSFDEDDYDEEDDYEEEDYEEDVFDADEADEEPEAAPEVEQAVMVDRAKEINAIVEAMKKEKEENQLKAEPVKPVSSAPPLFGIYKQERQRGPGGGLYGRKFNCYSS